MKSHDLIDKRSLAFGEAIAAHLRDDPKLIDHARKNIARWLETCSAGVRPALLEWSTAIETNVEAVLELLIGADERAVRLRQSNPFAGLLSQRERNEILLRFQSYEQTST